MQWFRARSGRVLPELVKHTIESPLTLHVPRYDQHTIERSNKSRKNSSIVAFRGYFVEFRKNLIKLFSCSQPFNESCVVATSDIFCITGGISAITGSLIACFGVYPRNQARIRIYLECFGCALVIVGVLVLLLSLRLRSRNSNRHHHQHHHQPQIHRHQHSCRHVFENLLDFQNRIRRTSLSRQASDICRNSLRNHESVRTTRRLTAESLPDWQPTAIRFSLDQQHVQVADFQCKDKRRCSFSSNTKIVGEEMARNFGKGNFLRKLPLKLTSDEEAETAAPQRTGRELELAELVMLGMHEKHHEKSNNSETVFGNENEIEVELEESESSENTGNNWMPPDVDDEEFYAQNHQVAVEAALSTVLTVSTLAGFRVVGNADQMLSNHNQVYCCLHHAIQHKLSAQKWIKRLRMPTNRVVSIVETRSEMLPRMKTFVTSEDSSSSSGRTIKRKAGDEDSTG